jgi:hypothetical protein
MALTISVVQGRFQTLEGLSNLIPLLSWKISPFRRMSSSFFGNLDAFCLRVYKRKYIFSNWNFPWITLGNEALSDKPSPRIWFSLRGRERR